MNPYFSQDYREILRAGVAERKSSDPRHSYQELAAAARVQKSYMSKVLKGAAQLSTDQLYLICRYLGMDADSSRYLLLLLERERSGLEERRAELTTLIDATRAPYLESQAHLNVATVTVSTGGMAEYYLDPFVQLVHVCLFIEAYRSSPAVLARDLGQTTGRVLDALGVLERLGVITKKEKSWIALTTNLHLNRLSPVYRPWRTQLKLLSLGRLDSLRDENSYSFASIFSGSRSTFDAIRVKFLSLLSESDQLIKAAPDKNVFQMSFDLFPWTERQE